MWLQQNHTESPHCWISTKCWVIVKDNSIQKPPFLLETRDFQLSLCGNPVSNRRTPKTPLNRNCSDTKKKKKTVMPDCAVIRWIKNINSVNLNSATVIWPMFLKINHYSINWNAKFKEIFRQITFIRAFLGKKAFPYFIRYWSLQYAWGAKFSFPDAFYKICVAHSIHVQLG